MCPSLMRTPGSALRGGVTSFPRTLRQADVFRGRPGGRREIAPRKRRILPVGLAEGDCEARERQLPAQVERVRRFVYAELLEDGVDVFGTHEPIVVEDRDRLEIGKDAEIRI